MPSAWPSPLVKMPLNPRRRRFSSASLGTRNSSPSRPTDQRPWCTTFAGSRRPSCARSPHRRVRRRWRLALPSRSRCRSHPPRSTPRLQMTSGRMEHMALTPQPTRWRVLGASVRGAAHARADLPNQDALAWLPPTGTEWPLVLSLADGHGSPRSFRSAAGAHLAVDVTLRELSAFLARQGAHPDLEQLRQLGKDQLPQAIVSQWKAAVAEALAQDPLEETELERLEAQAGVGA